MLRKLLGLTVLAACAGAVQAGMGAEMGGRVRGGDAEPTWALHLTVRPWQYIDVGFAFGREYLGDIYYDYGGKADSMWLTARANWPRGVFTPYFGARFGLSNVSYTYFQKEGDYTHSSSRKSFGGGPGVEVAFAAAFAVYAEGGYHVYFARDEMDKTAGYGTFAVGFTAWMVR